jgi:hypothetical protein
MITNQQYNKIDIQNGNLRGEVLSLKEKIKILHDAIKKHRDQKSDDRCWMDDQELYAVLNDGNLGDNHVGDIEQMRHNCNRFLENRCTGGKWKTYAELEKELNDCLHAQKSRNTGLDETI